MISRDAKTGKAAEKQGARGQKALRTESVECNRPRLAKAIAPGVRGETGESARPERQLATVDGPAEVAPDSRGRHPAVFDTARRSGPAGPNCDKYQRWESNPHALSDTGF